MYLWWLQIGILWKQIDEADRMTVVCAGAIAFPQGIIGPI